MDFIERWLHISPDNGDGSLEAFMVAAAVFILISPLIASRPFLSKLYRRDAEPLETRKREE